MSRRASCEVNGGVTSSRYGLSASLRLLLLGALLTPLLACQGFFQCENKAACPSTTTTTTTNTTDVAYVAYTTSAGSSVITGYNVAGGALTAINTVMLPFVPEAMAVNAANTRLYVASVPGYASRGIYEYTISSTGALSAANSGSALATDLVGAMAISADGNYLFTLQSTGLTLTEYTVNASSGALTSVGILTVPSFSCGLSVTIPVLPTCSIAVSPENNYVVAALGSQGDAVFTYSSSSGITNNGAYSQITAGASSADFSVALDTLNRLYIAQTATISSWAIASTGNTNRGTYTYPSGSIPRSVVVSSDAAFVYTADAGTSRVTGFATGTTTALTTLSGSPYTAPANVAALGLDNTGDYLVAAGYSATAGVQLFSISSAGLLTATKSAATSTATQYPVLVAMSH